MSENGLLLKELEVVTTLEVVEQPMIGQKIMGGILSFMP